MIVPLELKTIADRCGALTPDVAIGYRAGVHARESFDAAENLRGLVLCNANGCYPVRLLLGDRNGAGRVLHHDIGEYRFVFMHEPTQTVLNALARTEFLALPPCGRTIEDSLQKHGRLNESDWSVYSKLIECLVGRIVATGVENLFSLSMYRCRPAFPGSQGLLRFIACQRCGSSVRMDRAYDVEGFTLCAGCAGVTASWFDEDRRRVSALRSEDRFLTSGEYQLGSDGSDGQLSNSGSF